MFVCLYSLTVPVAALVRIAEDFTPRFEVIGPLVMLDASGLSRLFGTPRDITDQVRRASSGRPVRVALAPTQTAAALLALGRPGVVTIAPDELPAALAVLPVTVLGDFERLRTTRLPTFVPALPRAVTKPAASPPHVGEMWDVLPSFQSSLGRTSEAAAAPHRATPLRGSVARRSAVAAGHEASAPAATPDHTSTETHPESLPPRLAAAAQPSLPVAAATPTPPGGGWTHPRDAHVAASTRSGRRRARTAQERSVDATLLTLSRWGIATLGQLAALSSGDLYERLGARGVVWQRLARGADSTPLVPWVPEDPFESALALEWPIEGLEPLSFVLGRLFEPLADRLERADRGAAILHTHLRLVDRTVHARTVPLPAPIRDPKTLRTLVVLDLETHPPSAAIDHVRVLVEPTPARVTQWALFERAQPSPEQVSTVLARLTALVGDSHVGSPRLVDSWKPGVFDMTPFAPASAPAGATAGKPGAPDAPSAPGAPVAPDAPGAPGAPGTALRRFRLPIPARVTIHDSRPVRLTTDRRGVSGGAIIQSAGPWRTSGDWWNDARPGGAWDRDEWDVALADGTVYRLFVEREIGQWFLEGVVD